jgi:hypothetical protein
MVRCKKAIPVSVARFQENIDLIGFLAEMEGIGWRKLRLFQGSDCSKCRVKTAIIIVCNPGE